LNGSYRSPANLNNSYRSPANLNNSYRSPTKLGLSARYTDDLFVASRRLETAQKEYEETLNRSFSRSTRANSVGLFSTPARTPSKSISFIDSGYGYKSGFNSGYKSATKTSLRLP